MNKKSSPNIALCIFCLAVVFFKLWLVSGEEIVARFQPLDDLWQLAAAARGYWFANSYDWTTYVRLPVYPLWVAAVYLTGMPLRIAIELFYLASGFLFILALVYAKVPRSIAFIVYLSIALQPATFSLFNYALADTLYAPLLLLTLAAMISLWINRHHRNLFGHAVLAGIAVALLWVTRPETVLLSGLLFSFFLLATWILRKEAGGLRNAMRQLVIIVLVPCAMIFATTLALKTANYSAFGLFTSTEISAPGFNAASKALLRIKPEQSLRFIPITRQARTAAYAASPAFQELQPLLEGSNFGMLETERSMGIPEEIAAGWFYWVLRQSAAAAGHGQSPLAMDAYFQKIADELNAALDSGKLPQRPVWSDLLDPDPTNYVPYLGESLARISRLFTAIQIPVEMKDDADESTSRIFDIIANRRAGLVTQSPTTISGWVFGDIHAVQKLSLRSASGVVLGFTGHFLPRPDVASGFSAGRASAVPENTGFSLKMSVAPEDAEKASLVVEIDTGREIVMPLQGAPIGQALQQGDGDGKITLAIDSLKRLPPTHTAEAGIQRMLGSIYSQALIFLGYMGLIAGAVLLACYRLIDTSESRYMILWLCSIALALRVALITVIDASSWPGNQVRYLFPVMQIYGGFLVLLIYTALHLLRTRYTMSKPRIRH